MYNFHPLFLPDRHTTLRVEIAGICHYFAVARETMVAHRSHFSKYYLCAYGHKAEKDRFPQR